MTDKMESMSTIESAARQPYVRPAVVQELKLETRAGSGYGPSLTDPLGVDPANSQGN